MEKEKEREYIIERELETREKGREIRIYIFFSFGNL